MLKLFVIVGILLCCNSPLSAQDKTPPPVSSDMLRETYERDGVHFKRLNDFVWVHTSYLTMEKWGMVLSNGLIIVTEQGAVLVDTAWNNRQTEAILSWTRDVLGTRISSAVFTHAHEDKMGGVPALKKAGVATYAHPLSNRLAPSHNLSPAEFDLTILEGGVAQLPRHSPATDLARLNIFYPGTGHTKDNIVVQIEGTKILFGGCLIRPGGSKNMGYTAEGSLVQWGPSIDRVAHHFPEASIVIPSHGPPAGRELLSLTSSLSRAAQKPKVP